MFKTWNSVERIEEPYTQSQFWQRTNFIKRKSRYCISLNEYIVDMIYNIASNT